MTNFSVQDAAGSTKEFKATSGDGSGGSPFVSEVGLADVGETVDVGRVNLIGTAQSNGAVRATAATVPAYAVAMGVSDGTNLQIPKCDASNFLKALASSTPVTHSVTIMAQAGNSGNIYVGNSLVSSSSGYILDAGDTIEIKIANLSTIYIDSSVNGEGVHYIAS